MLQAYGELDPESGIRMDVADASNGSGPVIDHVFTTTTTGGDIMDDVQPTGENLEHDADLESNTSGGARKRRNMQQGDWAYSVSGAEAPKVAAQVDSKIKIALSLYKVQQNIYLLDFQRVEVIFSMLSGSSCCYSS